MHYTNCDIATKPNHKHLQGEDVCGLDLTQRKTLRIKGRRKEFDVVLLYQRGTTVTQTTGLSQ